MLTLYGYVANWLKLNDEQGVTAIEYGLIAALIALAIITGVTLLGTNLGALFNNIAGQIAPAS